MDSDPFRYDAWIEEALRGVIRRSLTYASENSLPGEHHFYLTFHTGNDAEGVEVPPYLRDEHPDEMTIVLQHEFDELIVNEDAVWVTLKFNGKPERLRIPFDAMISFADPSVNFGLQLKMSNEPEDDISLEHPMAHNADTDMDQGTGTDGETPKEAPAAKGMGEVIALDAFRKK
jgi:hypothetical protein